MQSRGAARIRPRPPPVVVVVVVVEVYLTSHHKQAISPPLIHVDDRRNERREGGDRSTERGRVEIYKQINLRATPKQKRNGNTYYIQNNFMSIFAPALVVVEHSHVG